MMHTETPWEASEWWYCRIAGHPHRYITIHNNEQTDDGYDGYGIAVCLLPQEDDTPEVATTVEANARFIVRAANSHDELVEACAVALHVFDRIARETPWGEITPDWWLDMMARMVVVRAALKKAGA